MLYYLAVAVLVPTRRKDFKDLDAYFYKIRPHFFTFLALINVAMAVPALIGVDYVEVNFRPCACM